MILSFVAAFEAKRAEMLAAFSEKHPSSYHGIVRSVIEVVSNPDEGRAPDPERIHLVDDGDYQGTQVFIIGASGYQPSDYWYVRVAYGSCSGCDTLEGIRDYGEGKPTEQQARDYMTLALHVVQGLRKMDDLADAETDL